MVTLAVVFAAGIVGTGGCTSTPINVARATRAYPRHLHLTEHVMGDAEPVMAPASIDVQVFRDGSEIELVNAMPRSYRDFDLWINQRYVRRVASMPAGATVRLSLREFYDMRGEVFNAGGFWRTVASTPIRMVELQMTDQTPLLGLVAIAEPDDGR
ncbi:MAG: hypothetical protein KJO43_06600 [Phycisphaerae bacterium]|nr:hypothetical protein [Phycisphaerae bacterium]